MLSWNSVVSVAVCLWAATGSLAGPLEIRPYHETLVVEAPFGEDASMFAPRSPNWGRNEEVGGFGPFAVGPDGRIYIADTKANDIKVFAPDGSFLQSVDMRHIPNLVHDLAVLEGKIFWMGETVWGDRLVFAVDPATGDTTRIEATMDHESRSLARGGRLVGDWRMVVTGGGISLFGLRAGKSYPVYRHGRPLSMREREAAEKPGIAATSAPSIAFTWEKTTTTAGEETHGDIVRLTPDGRPEKILVRDAGAIRGVATRCFLHSHSGKTRPYMVVTDYDGQTLARTEMPRRSSDRYIEIPHRWRLAEDCSYYELYLTDQSVCVARWSAE